MRNRTKQSILFGSCAIFFLLMPSIKGMAENLQPPQLVIQSVSEKLQKKLQDKSFAGNFAQVVQFVNDVIEPHTDFNRIAQLVLGKHWKTATIAERERFKNEFRILLVRTYSRAFVEYKDWTLNYLPLDLSKNDAKVIIKTKVLQPGIKPVDVNYRMFLNKGEWKVYDIMIEGVSLVTNYRSSFNEDIQRKGSLSAVIDSLAQRNTEALKAKGS